MREPLEGEVPEFLVMEIKLPGIVSECQYLFFTCTLRKQGRGPLVVRKQDKYMYNIEGSAKLKEET